MANSTSAFYDAFISYGRVDSKAFALTLNQRLKATGLSVWLDQDDIPLGVDFQKQIDEAIAHSHNFIFVISPHSANSPYCALEIERALHFKKRIIPVLQVEAINQEVWQQRNPSGTAADWVAYQQQGLHSGVANLNRAISRINWVLCREGIDNFETAFQGLLALLQRDQGYVQQHTHLLVQALNWQRQQHQPTRLLVGAARLEAQQWLTQRFNDRQPPCLPTGLHAEYIGESQKYANQWMTQVFLSFADEDREYQEALRLLLLLEGITVWSSRTDIQLGKDFQTEINRGIENADNLIVLLSPRTLQSIYCLYEISYALALNKRIIPLLIEPIDLSSADPPASTLGLRVSAEVNSQGTAQQAGHQQARENAVIQTIKTEQQTLAEPMAAPLLTAAEVQKVKAQLQQIQFLEFIGPLESDHNRQSLDKLIKRLQDDAPYLREHKELLVQALKWQRQQHNPSILLRGSALRYYEAWTRLAAQRQAQMPTELQHQFVQASLQQPADSALDVFLLSAPEDLAFARKLNDVLQVQGKTTWALSDELKQEFNSADETQRGLEQCQNVVLILSPSWVAAADCQHQLTVALSLNKRIVPVLYRPVESSKLPQPLTELPWVNFCSPGKDFLSAFGELYRRLESEPEHVRGHTRLLVRAKTWEEAGRDDSYLLRGRELAAAEAWLEQAGNKTPQPIPLQQDLIAVSRALPQRRIKVRSLLWSTAAVTLLVFVLRLLGGLQPLELWAYDLLLRLRPNELSDERFLLVEMDSKSGDWLRQQMKENRYQPSIGTIPDGALNEALAVLSAHNPALIGLDFYRDFEAEPVVRQRLAETPNLIAMCKTLVNGQGVAEPPEIPPSRVGFNDFAREGSNFVRRHYIKLEPQENSPFCNTTDSFSLLLTRQYLAQQGIAYTDPWVGSTGVQDMRVGTTRVPQLVQFETAAYTPLNQDRLAGYQTLINFRRSNGGIHDFAERVSLQALLTGQVSRAQVEGRIVLMGYTDTSDRNADSFNTAYGEMPGVVIQGQMASQLISAALDGRPLIWWLPPEGSLLWIGLWAFGGGLISWRIVAPARLALASASGLVVLIVVCYSVLVLWAGWVPLVPSALAAAGTAGVVAALTHRIRHP